MQEPHPHPSHVVKLTTALLQDNRNQVLFSPNDVKETKINQQILTLAAFL